MKAGDHLFSAVLVAGLVFWAVVVLGAVAAGVVDVAQAI